MNRLKYTRLAMTRVSTLCVFKVCFIIYRCISTTIAENPTEVCTKITDKAQRPCLVGATLKTLKPFGFQQCIKECKSWSICGSINYRKSSLSCELNLVDSNTMPNISDVFDEDCRYMYVKNGTSEMKLGPDPCSCSNNEVCMVRKSGHPLCMAIDYKISVSGCQTGASPPYKYDDKHKKENAIDGYIISFSHSRFEYTNYPYWWVMLNDTVVVTKVQIFKRKDFYDRFRDITVYTGLTLDDMYVCDTFAGPDNTAVRMFECSQIRQSRYIKLDQRSVKTPRILTLTEIKVYGLPLQ